MTTVLPLRFLARLLVLGMLTTLVAALEPAPALAADNPRPTPAVWDVSPATGELVSAGQVEILGTAVAPGGAGGIASVEITVDGVELATEIVDQNSEAARARAVAELTPGEHIATYRFTMGDGSQQLRSWRLSATDVGLQRLAGADRIATAVATARNQRGASEADGAVLARADDFADALAGAPLAAQVGGPLLLTSRDQLAAETATALTDLLRQGATVHLLGGAGALSPAVEQAVSDLGFQVVRHQGATRYETAVAIARALPDADRAVLASGVDFPDALAVASPAASQGLPILLSLPDRLPEATASYLAEVDRVTLVGGPAALSSAVADAAQRAAGTADRVFGDDRYATAVRIADAFGTARETVGIANGLSFADALAGSVDVARTGGPLLLVRPNRVPSIVVGHLAARAPSSIRVYGGTGAIDAPTATTARASARDRGPEILSENPGANEEINSLDTLQFTFDEPLDLQHTSVSVLFDGRELPTTPKAGDFEDTLVLSVGPPPTEPRLFEARTVRVVGVVRAGDTYRHVDRLFTYRKIAMSRGDAGSEVRQVQDRLVQLGYWLGTPDGTFGSLTVQAIMAFQKHEGLAITGAADGPTQERLATARRPVPQRGGGYHLEIDKSKQIMLIVGADGSTTWTFNVSTGSEIPYDEEGGSGSAVTPTGTFSVCRQVDGLREADLGTLWRPKYFQCNRGIAVHGATNVPSYPASHGCVRVTYAAMDFIWANNYMPIGTTVHVYGAIPAR